METFIVTRRFGCVVVIVKKDKQNRIKTSIIIITMINPVCVCIFPVFSDLLCKHV